MSEYLSNEVIKGWLISVTHLAAANAVRSINITEPTALARLVEGTELSLKNATTERDRHDPESPEWQVHNGGVIGHQQFLRSLLYVHEGLLDSYTEAGAELKKHLNRRD